MCKSEVWVPIKDYEGYYEINSDGLVKSVQRKVPMGETNRSIKEKILKQRLNNHGYAEVRLSKFGEPETIFVHTLMARAFIPNPEKKPEVNHKNGVKDDNRIENIEWVTHSENMIHAYKMGLIKPKGKAVVDVCNNREYTNTRLAALALGLNYHTLRSRLNGRKKGRIICLQFKDAD